MISMSIEKMRKNYCIKVLSLNIDCKLKAIVDPGRAMVAYAVSTLVCLYPQLLWLIKLFCIAQLEEKCHHFVSFFSFFYLLSLALVQQSEIKPTSTLEIHPGHMPQTEGQVQIQTNVTFLWQRSSKRQEKLFLTGIFCTNVHKVP